MIMSYFSKLFDSLVIFLKCYCYCKKAIQCSLCLIPVLGLHTCVFAAQTDIDSLHQDSQFTQILASPVDEISVGCDSCNFLGTLCLSAVYFKGSSTKTVHAIIIHHLQKLRIPYGTQAGSTSLLLKVQTNIEHMERHGGGSPGSFFPGATLLASGPSDTFPEPFPRTRRERLVARLKHS